MTEDRESLRDRFAAFQYGSMERIATKWPPKIGLALFQAYGRISWRFAPKWNFRFVPNDFFLTVSPPHCEFLRGGNHDRDPQDHDVARGGVFRARA